MGGGGRVRGGCRVGGCQGGWKRRIEAFVKIQKKKKLGGGGRVGGGGSGWGGGFRVDVNGEVKLFFLVGGGGGGGRGRVGGSGWM